MADDDRAQGRRGRRQTDERGECQSGGVGAQRCDAARRRPIRADGRELERFGLAQHQ